EADPATCDHAIGVSSNEQLLVGRYHPYLEARTVGTDSTFCAIDGGLIEAGIELDAKGLQPLQDVRANLCGILAHTAREADRARRAERRQIRPNVLPHAVGEYVYGQSRTTIVHLARLGNQLSHVVRETRNAQKPGLLVQ